MNKKWFYKLLSSYLPILILVSVGLAVVIFFAMSQQLRKEAEKSNRMFIENVRTNMDNSLRAIDQLIIHEILRKQFDPFVSVDSQVNRSYSAYLIINLLRDLSLNNPLIDSIYLYRQDDHTVLTQNLMLPLDSFGDKEFILKWRNHTETFYWTGKRSYTQPLVDRSQPVQVISLIREIPVMGQLPGMAVINVNIDTLHRMIAEMSNQFSFVQIYDRNGRSLLDNLNASDSSDRGGKALSTVVSNYTQWKFQSGVKNGVWLEAFSRVWLVIGACIFLSGIAAVVYISRFHYKPVEALLAQIDAFSAKKMSQLFGKRVGDEFTFIGGALEKLMEQTTSFQKNHEENLIFRRQHLFREVMEGSRSFSPEEWRTEMDYLNLSGDYEQPQAAVVEIDKYNDFAKSYSNRDLILLKYALTCVVNEVSAAEGQSVWAEWMDTHQIGLICMNAQSNEDVAKIMIICEKVQEWVLTNLPFSITIGIGSQVDNANECYLSFDEALDALKYKSVMGDRRVIGHWEIAKVPAELTFVKLNLIRSMSCSFRLGEDSWQQDFRSITEGLRIGFCSREEVKNVMNYMLYHLHREMAVLSADMQEIWKTGGLNPLNEIIDTYETLDDIASNFNAVLLALSEKLSSLKEVRSNHALVQKVREYIEKNFANPDLSLTHLGDEFHITGSYLSRLFKDEIGEKFVDYLARVRIEQAKTMLMLNGETPVQEIGNRVGYSHAKTFIRIFKKQVGCTPGEFRKEMHGDS